MFPANDDQSCSDQPRQQLEQVSRVGEAIAEFLVAADARESFDVDKWLLRYADVADVLREFIGDHLRVGQFVAGSTTVVNWGGITPALNVRDFASVAKSRLRPADMVGPYEVLHELGRGGMGVVYAARHRQLNRLVALKVLKLGAHASEDDCRRFEREVEAVARLDHPAIIPVYEVGQHQGIPFFAMKLIEGGTLRQWLEEHTTAADHRSMRDVIRCLLQIASGVQHAHERGVLHRDLKPANILLDKDRHPVVADFGLAKDFDSTETTVGRILGTPGYIAPEQVAGVSTIASDIWAFGAVMYALLTSQPPFAGSSFSDYVRNLEVDRPLSPRKLNPEVPRDIQTICMKCLRYDAASRYASMAEVRGDLQAYLDNRPISARPVSLVEATTKFLQRNSAAAVAYTLLLTVFLAAGSWVVIDGQRSRQEVLLNRLRAEAAGLATAISIADLEQLEPLLTWRTELDEGVRFALRREWQLASQTDSDLAEPLPANRLKMLNIALALADEPDLHPWLWTQLELGTPREVSVSSKRLGQYDPQFRSKCEARLGNHESSIDQKLRLAAAISYVNRSYRLSSELAQSLVEKLLQMPPLEFAEWARLLQIQLRNCTQELLAILQDDEAVEQRRLYAAELLSQSTDELTLELFEPLLESRPQEFSIMWRRCTGEQRSSLARRAEDYFSVLSDALPSDTRELRRLARAGVIVALAGEFELLLGPLANVQDPRLGTQLIHNLPAYGLEVAKLWQVTKDDRAAASRFGLLSCLAGYPQSTWPDRQLEEARTMLSEWYMQESDSGVRAVAELILRRWGSEPSKTVQPLDERAIAGRRWFVNSQLQTYVVIDAERFSMGSASNERERDADEVQHFRNISRSFAIAATEVTLQDFLSYRPDFPFRGRGIADSESRPVGGVDWYSAAAYCNWLSEQDGIPREQWCYEPNDAGEYAAGMRVAHDSLQRIGYRLPTEAEWEFACRAGSLTSRYYGNDVALLEKYGWYSMISNDRSQAVGLLLPNRFGLFDTLGNVYEWCHDVYSPYPAAEGEQIATAADPLENELTTYDAQRRNLRGGSYDYSARHSRAAYRTNDLLDFVVGNDGFRPARTLPKN